MTSTQIRGLIGSPSTVEGRSSGSIGFRYDSLWTYEFSGWLDKIHIYFDKGKVVEFDYNHG